MKKSRKELGQKIYELEGLLTRLEWTKDFLVETKGEGEYLHFANYLQSSIDRLTEERKALPIGHRFTGTFYLRVPYSSPAKCEKFEGSIYMKEDLVSWKRDDLDEWKLYRAAFRDADMRNEISRTDGEPVFEN